MEIKGVTPGVEERYTSTPGVIILQTKIINVYYNIDKKSNKM